MSMPQERGSESRVFSYTKKISDDIFFEICNIYKTDIALWQECFSDSEEEIAYSLDELYDCGFCARLKNEKEVLSQFVGIETSLHSQKGFYIYALCTSSAHRGKGYMKALIESCAEYGEKNGYSYCWLFPATPELQKAYERLGFCIPVVAGASPLPRTLSDFFLYLDTVPSLKDFDGSFERLYSFSSKVLPFFAFRFALTSVCPYVDIKYTSDGDNEDGYIIFSKGSRTHILGTSKNYEHLQKCIKRKFAYLMPLSSYIPSENIFAEPILR